MQENQKILENLEILQKNVFKTISYLFLIYF